MLRSSGTTYVCDVNGFSFVKTSDKYYQDCALMLKKIIYKKLRLTWNPNEQTEESSKFFKANRERLEKNRTKALIDDDTKSIMSSQMNRPYRPIDQTPEKT